MNKYVKHKSNALEQLLQIAETGMVHEDDLVDKKAAEYLHEQGMIKKTKWFNTLSETGVWVLVKLGFLQR